MALIRARSTETGEVVEISEAWLDRWPDDFVPLLRGRARCRAGRAAAPRRAERPLGAVLPSSSPAAAPAQPAASAPAPAAAPEQPAPRGRF
jgi:hypothetical protein